MKNNKRTQGFTLIELLIVIAIIGILAAVLIPNLLGAQKRAYDTGSQACAKSIQTAQATFQIDKQAYFKVDKASAAADADPTFAAGAVTAAGAPANFADSGLSQGCRKGNITIATVGSPSASDYTITVNDNRGKNTYTITPSNLTGS